MHASGNSRGEGAWQRLSGQERKFQVELHINPPARNKLETL